MKRKLLSLFLAAALTAGLFAGMALPAAAAERFSPDSIYEHVSAIDTWDWAMVVGQDHILWVYDMDKNWSAQSLMTDVDSISLREQGASRDIYVLKTDGSLWYVRDRTYEGNDYSTIKFSQPARIMSNVKEIRDEYALTTDGAVYELSGSQAQPTGERGVATIASNSCRGMEAIGDEPIPCADPDKCYFFGDSVFVLSENGDLWSWGETTSGGVGIPLNDNYYVQYSHILFAMGNYTPGWRVAPICFFSAPARILTNVKTVWVDDKACYAEKRDGTLWKWGDGAPVEVNFNGTSFTDEVREPKDQTGWTPRQVSYPPSWDMVLNTGGGSLRLCFYADGRLILNPKDSNIRLKDWASDPGNATPFTDVKSSAYYYDAVKWALDKGVTAGMDTTHFGPSAAVTRGQCVTFLWRAMGCPEPASANPFADVSASQYYSKAVLWAVEKGITNGVDSTHFDPNGTLSTRHIVTFLYRTLNPGKDGWQGEAARWARENDPKGQNKPFGVDVAIDNSTPCSRANVVQFLYTAVK